ncbi:hypothetical protein CTH_10046 (plasmid) [Carboxydocella thermautotrophica]|nr:hypothetical protein CTH_10046 [Carboxydocella thermautotrophica]
MPKKLMNFNDELWEVIQQYKKDFKFSDDAEAIRDLIRKALIAEKYLQNSNPVKENK